MFELSDRAISKDDLIAWLRTPVIDPLPKDVAHEHFLLMHPRVSFLKTLPINAAVFDIGAGDGNLRSFREWLGFPRQDLKFIGVSLDHGSKTRDYEEFHLVNLDEGKPNFGILPTAAVAAQFLEHVAKPAELIEWLYSALPTQGRVFLDWPSAHTPELPCRSGIIAAGFDITTLNFHDDATHVTAYSINAVAEMLSNAGFSLISAGHLDMPFVAESLKHHGIADRDHYILSMAVWLKTRFVSYISAEKR